LVLDDSWVGEDGNINDLLGDGLTLLALTFLSFSSTLSSFGDFLDLLGDGGCG
jgi:hypothetical protein